VGLNTMPSFDGVELEKWDEEAVASLWTQVVSGRPCGELCQALKLRLCTARPKLCIQLSCGDPLGANVSALCRELGLNQTGTRSAGGGNFSGSAAGALVFAMLWQDIGPGGGCNATCQAGRLRLCAADVRLCAAMRCADASALLVADDVHPSVQAYCESLPRVFGGAGQSVSPEGLEQLLAQMAGASSPVSGTDLSERARGVFQGLWDRSSGGSGPCSSECEDRRAALCRESPFLCVLARCEGLEENDGRKPACTAVQENSDTASKLFAAAGSHAETWEPTLGHRFVSLLIGVYW